MAGALVGVKLLRVSGGTVRVKAAVLVTVPLGVVMVISPVVVPGGTVAVSLVADFTLTVVLGTPLKVTLVAPVRPLPVMVTKVVMGPLVGVKLVILGSTTKEVALVAVPPGVVTEMAPVEAAAGNLVVIWVSELTVKVVAATPLNLTAVAPVKPEP